jgi:hypothetical protein
MFRKWFLAHRSLVITAISAFVVVAVVAVVAIASNGYTAQQLNLNDSSVWVTNGTQQAIGRANTTVHQLNSVVSTTGTSLDVLQQGNTVLLVDNASSKLEVVDPATSTVTQTVPLPPGEPQVFLSAENVVIVAQTTGEVWVVPLADIASFDSQSAATLSLGAGIAASMDDAGTMFVYAPSSHQVDRIDPDLSSAVNSHDRLNLPAKDFVSITSVADRWAVLDSTTHRVYQEGSSVSLRGTAAATSPAIQEASSTGTQFLVAGSTGLVSLGFGGGVQKTLASGESGIPAQPLVVGGCEYAAWTGGDAWRLCSGDVAGTTLPLNGVSAGMKLELRANGNRVVLNDAHGGASWAVQSGGQLIDNWSALITPKDQQQQQNHNEDTPPQVQKQQLPPVAVNDNLGARPGRTSLLPVLLNDYDPNGDVLAITDVTSISSKVGHLDIINNSQELQLTLAASASGSLSFRYTITDGRGGTASATVTVAIRAPGDNTPPKQVNLSKTTVVEGGRVTTQVLGDWEDPDGDPMYVTNASVDKPDSVSFTPDGTIVYSDAGKTTGLKTVSVTVSDGRATTTGTLTVTVKAAGKVPIIADPFLVTATSGEPLTVSPLAHVRGGSATLRLNSVPSKTGVTVTPSYDAGTFQVESTQVGTHYLDYVVTDGDESTTGVVRVDVSAPPDVNAKPITIPKTVFVRSLSTASVDVADSDIDPSGGVLLVTGISNLAANSGVSTEILQQRTVRVTLTKPLDAPVAFNYTITNGLADATGTITVIEIPTPTHFQPPIANDDSITVRAGAAIDIPVLNNDTDPDGGDLTLVPTLARNLPAGAGLLFPSGDVLRYLAPQKPGNYTAVYAVAGPDGQTARAQVHIAVREADVNTNNPPVPETLTARVLAGGSVEINVPLSGIDPDGDTVQLLGQSTNPEKGIVTAVSAHTITYKAGDYSAGTDSFTYGVIDALGARATGTIRVGIAAKPAGSPNPVATLDEVTVRPGVTVSVQVLANDSDPDGSPLHLVSVKPNGNSIKAKIVGDLVSIKPPDAPGVYGVVYTIANATGGESTAYVRVTVDPKAPLAVPVATDSVLTLNDIVGRTSVDVNVLANVFFADGPSSSLDLAVYPGYTNVAQVTPTRHIRVQVTAHSQIIPFRVTNPADASVFSYAFIWVPGTDDALPQLNRDAPALSVKSGATITIPLNTYVIAVGNKRVQLTDPSSVTATHSDGNSLVVSDDTLQFTSAPHYFGPASISFGVTDGSSPTDPNGHTSTLVLPITVLPQTNQPPVFSGGVIDLEPGQSVNLDLTKLTTYPYQNDIYELVYNLPDPVVDGFSATLSQQHLTIRANDNAAQGETANLEVGVRDANSTGTAGRIQLVIVPSTKPLAQAAPDTAVVQRGETTTVDVLANDQATNPYPATPLRVIAIRGLDGNSLPAGLTVTPSDDKSRLTVSASASALPGDTTLQYEVADATNDPARYVWGNVRISVEDKPDPVTNVRVTDFSDKHLTVAWDNGSSNNSPITGYQVIESDPSSGDTISTSACGGSLCSVATPGNGPDNAVRLAVTAKNAIGTSDSSSLSGTVWSDVVPNAPTDLDSTPLDHGLTITWTKPPDAGGTPITKYVISIDGVSSQELTVPAGDAVGTAYSKAITDPSIDDGSNIGYSVSGRNSAFSALANWNKASGTGHPAGPPVISSAPNVSVDDDNGASASLDWSSAFDNNGRAISNYYAAIFSPGSVPPTCGESGAVPGSPVVPAQSSTFQYLGTGTSTTFTGLTANDHYDFVVYAFNGMGCTASETVTGIPRMRPGVVTSIDSDGPSADGSHTWDFTLNDFTIGSGSTDVDSFEYQLSGGSVDGGTYGPDDLGSSLVTSNNSQYGQNISVQVKACRKYPEVTLCSATWSASFHLGVPVDNSALGGLSFAHDPFGTILDPPVNGTWTWSSSPAGAYDSISYSCGSDTHTMSPGDGGSCATTQTNSVTQDFPPLTITINVNGNTYVRTYNWSDYD